MGGWVGGCQTPPPLGGGDICRSVGMPPPGHPFPEEPPRPKPSSPSPRIPDCDAFLCLQESSALKTLAEGASAVLNPTLTLGRRVPTCSGSRPPLHYYEEYCNYRLQVCNCVEGFHAVLMQPHTSPRKPHIIPKKC